MTYANIEPSDHLWIVDNYGLAVMVFGRNYRDDMPRFGIITGKGLMDGYVHVHIYSHPYNDVHQRGFEPVTAQPQVHLLKSGQMPEQTDTHWCYPLVRPGKIKPSGPPMIQRRKKTLTSE